MTDIKTHKIEELPDFLEENDLELVPDTARWEPDPHRPGLGRLAIEVRKIEHRTETDN